jgi:hypothetical protein
MLSSAEAVAPWLVNVFPFMASAFPLLGIVYTMMAETITETAAEEKGKGSTQLTALAELARQTNLPLGTLRRALTSGTTRLSPTALLSQATRANDETASEVQEAHAAPAQDERENGDVSRPITGQVVTVAPDAAQTPVSAPTGEGSTDKLQMTIEILRANPAISDEMLAEHLSLKRPASALFWRRKALEILNSQGMTEKAAFRA